MPAILRVDTKGQIGEWSREAEELLGYSALEAVGKSIEIIIPQHLRERHRAAFARYVQTGISALPEITTTIAVHKTGRHMKLPISVNAIYGKRQGNCGSGSSVLFVSRFSLVGRVEARTVCWCGRPLIPAVLWRPRRHS
jgi:PAS domain S-box-containing protein